MSTPKRIIFPPATDADDPDSFFRRGVLHEFGQFGYKKDIRLAVSNYLKAANKDHQDAMNRAACILLDGNKYGIEPDEKQALSLFQKAAGLGLPQAKFSLGLLHQTGRSPPPSQPKAGKAKRKNKNKSRNPSGETKNASIKPQKPALLPVQEKLRTAFFNKSEDLSGSEQKLLSTDGYNRPIYRLLEKLEVAYTDSQAVQENKRTAIVEPKEILIKIYEYCVNKWHWGAIQNDGSEEKIFAALTNNLTEQLSAESTDSNGEIAFVLGALEYINSLRSMNAALLTKAISSLKQSLDAGYEPARFYVALCYSKLSNHIPESKLNLIEEEYIRAADNNGCARVWFMLGQQPKQMSLSAVREQ